MIKAEGNNKGCAIEIKGNDVVLLAELTAIIADFLEEGIADERLIDIAVGLAKAKADGTDTEYMEQTIKEVAKETQAQAPKKEKLDKELDEILEGIKGLINELENLKNEDED